jgi:hypothetical protein
VYYLPDVYYKNDLLNDKNFKIHNTKEEQEEYYVKWEMGKAVVIKYVKK